MCRYFPPYQRRSQPFVALGLHLLRASFPPFGLNGSLCRDRGRFFRGGAADTWSGGGRPYRPYGAEGRSEGSRWLLCGLFITIPADGTEKRIMKANLLKGI